MLIVLLALQTLALLALIVLLLRRAAPSSDEAMPDARLALLPDQLTRLDARSEAAQAALDAHVRAAHAQLRTDLAAEAAATREASAVASTSLRAEVAGSIANLGATLHTGLDGFRADNRTSAETLRTAVHQSLDAIAQRLGGHIAEAARAQLEAREALHTRLTGLSDASITHQENLRATVGEALLKLNTDNEAKLEQMRATVDEKLQATLHTRLTESFGQVTDQLNKVHAGLGEMTKLSAGVDDLSRIFTNVKSRGGFAEVQLGMLLEQMLAPSQFVRNALVKPGGLERVEFAVRFPGHSGDTLLPIDAKFPREDWERLESAYAANSPEAIATAGRAFEASIRTEGVRICSKYINPPVTTPHAIMFLPTEGLYAEVMRRDTLQAEIQSKCQVTIAGPSTLSAILTSFQMGFHMLALQGKGDQIHKVLESAKVEFGKFGVLMGKVEGDFVKIQKTLGEVGVRTRAINRTLREVSDPSDDNTLQFEKIARPTLSLAATGDD
jgi:DNA recombination protein RmuC